MKTVTMEAGLGSMPVPRAELKLVRLLSRCEAMAADKRNPDEWRLEKIDILELRECYNTLKINTCIMIAQRSIGSSVAFGLMPRGLLIFLLSFIFGRRVDFYLLLKYVAALEEMLLTLKKHSSKPAPEVLNEYSRKVDFLKGLLEAEKLSSSSEKALANQFLAPGRTPTTARERTPATKTVHLQTKARFMGEMRNELLGTDPSYINDLEEKNLRKRMTPLPDEKQSAAELDAVLQHHHNIQEKLAEEMLHLARNLKNNTLVAQNVIKQDNQTLTQSLKLADQNFEKLKAESDRLEQHAKKSVNWLLWLMLIIVCFIFISMILFIRIFPKLR